LAWNIYCHWFAFSHCFCFTENSEFVVSSDGKVPD
jgi:hypothetical protein